MSASGVSLQPSTAYFAARLLRAGKIFLLVYCFAMLSGCSRKAPDPAVAIREFIAACATGKEKAVEAYQETTNGFRMEKSERYFLARVDDLEMRHWKVSEITPIDVQNKIAKLKTEVTSTTEEKLAMDFTLLLERGRWRVHEVMSVPASTKINRENIFAVLPRSQDTKTAGNRAFFEPVSVSLPPEHELQKLVEETIQTFNEAIQTQNFHSLFAYTSNRWKTRGQNEYERSADWKNKSNRLTVGALEKSFKNFVIAKVDFSKIKGSTMILDQPPRLSSDGVLTLEGRFDAPVMLGNAQIPEKQMEFKFEYVFETSRWRLFGISIDLKNETKIEPITGEQGSRPSVDVK